MSMIITARFQEQSEAQSAASALEADGFLPDKTATFYVGSPGQHDLYFLGGDEMKSPGMEDATSAGGVGATVGGSVGLITGLATLPVLGPAAVVAGTGIGAWVGSLYGALDGSKDAAIPVAGDAPFYAVAVEPPRKSGMLVAVMVDTVAQQASAQHVLRNCDGMDIGHAEGQIIAGDWVDFDPLAPVIPLSP